MRIERQYLDEPGEWHEITEDEFLRRCEWAGYFEEGTALQELKDIGHVGTPWADYRIMKEDDQAIPLSRRIGGMRQHSDGLN
jgi:hypothetical protein